MKKDYVNIGKRLPRIDGVVKATGEAKFAGDLSLPGMLHGKILRSPYPHARILNIYADKAKRLSGVRAVVNGKDTIGFKAGGISAVGDEPYLALDKVRFIGDAVAAVAAIDEETAEEALDLIEVDYEELPAVVDPEAAMSDDAPLIHDHAPRNISFKTDLSYGDADKAFKECDYVRQDRFETAPIRHGFIEPHAALASWITLGGFLFGALNKVRILHTEIWRRPSMFPSVAFEWCNLTLEAVSAVRMKCLMWIFALPFSRKKQAGQSRWW